MLKEFREFIIKGNAFDLAVGVIIGRRLRGHCHLTGRGHPHAANRHADGRP